MGLYIIRASVDGVLETRGEYNGPGKSADAVRKFKNKLFDVIRHANTVYQVPKINFEKYMVSFYVMANALQSLLFREIYYREQYIDAQYSKMPVENSNEIFHILDHYMKIPYHYCKETRVILMDDENMCAKIYTLNEDECFDLNSSEDVDVATKLYGKLADKVAVVQTSSKMNVIAMINQECNIASPTNKVCMDEWSESESSSDSSDDEDFDVKYTWEHKDDEDDDVKSVYNMEHYGMDDDEK